MERKVRQKIKQLTKVRSLLQKEVNSSCPFCNNQDVGHFQIHHIDENPSNNEMSNLILLCPTCHSKITKGDISKQEVIEIKSMFLTKHEIECVAITIDSNNCSWEVYENVKNAFKDRGIDKSPYPILNFLLINHSPKTILFTGVELKTKHLPSGLSGIPQPQVLKPIAKFKLEIPKENQTAKYQLMDEIEVPSGRAFKFQIELFNKWQNEYYPIDGRKVLYFSFEFNNSIYVKVPNVYLNCKNEDERMKIQILT